MDRQSLDAVAAYVGERLAPEGTDALLLVEIDGVAEAIEAGSESGRCRVPRVWCALRCSARAMPPSARPLARPPRDRHCALARSRH